MGLADYVQNLFNETKIKEKINSFVDVTKEYATKAEDGLNRVLDFAIGADNLYKTTVATTNGLAFRVNSIIDESKTNPNFYRVENLRQKGYEGVDIFYDAKEYFSNALDKGKSLLNKLLGKEIVKEKNESDKQTSNDAYSREEIKKEVNEGFKIYDNSKKIIDTLVEKAKAIHKNYFTGKKETKEEDLDQKVKNYSNTADIKPKINEKDVIDAKFEDISSNSNVSNTSYDIGKSYATNMANVKTNYSEKIGDLVDTLYVPRTGRKKQLRKTSWRWKDRVDLFEDQLSKVDYNSSDITGLQHLRDSIQSNKYLMRTDPKLANRLIGRINGALQNV